MNDDGFMLMPIKSLFDKDFLIPSYQRGYRWEEQQIRDLLNDIKDFMEFADENDIYSIQPLVVKKRTKDISQLKPKLNQALQVEYDKIEDVAKETFANIDYQYEVIDGQQRLTTIYLILKVFDEAKYTISYETRPKSQSFLEKINEEPPSDEAYENIDFYHIWSAYIIITTWLNSNKEIKDAFIKTLMNQVRFIWYEDKTDNPVETFTRLNVGKIPLTNSELIKALLLKKSNMKDAGNSDYRLTQLQMATEWDNIEFSLQDSEFWGFLFAGEWRNPTRIDFIFDLLIGRMPMDAEMTFSVPDEKLGKDGYRTFRYFYEYMKQKDIKFPHEQIWKKIRTIHQIFCQWYNDIELYHYVGFITQEKWCTIIELLTKYREQGGTKKSFIEYCINDIIKNKISKTDHLRMLDFQFDTSRHPNQQCEPILLLFNLQTIINQNNGYKSKKYNQGVFYKFPFHLYKSETWNIEHIDSNTENPLTDLNDQKEWLKYFYLGLEEKVNDGLKKRIIEYLHFSQVNDSEFESLKQALLSLLPDNDRLVGKEKDMIWNFAILDERTNKSYGNDIFPTKRRKIIGKDQGISIAIDDQLNITENTGEIAFIPPATRNVFMKYYTPHSSGIMSWNRKDAKEYRKKLYNILEQFGVQNPDKNQQGDEQNG